MKRNASDPLATIPRFVSVAIPKNSVAVSWLTIYLLKQESADSGTSLESMMKFLMTPAPRLHHALLLMIKLDFFCRANVFVSS